MLTLSQDMDAGLSTYTLPRLSTVYRLSQSRGQKTYELTNHLGNVLATISDRHLAIPSTTNPLQIDHFEPDITSAQDYYPFGMHMPGRTFAGGSYRYGFNGKENDHEVKGIGNEQDYGMRIYDSRIGKFLSVDPLQKQYPWYTPFQFAGNKPITCIDLDGLEECAKIKTDFHIQYEPVIQKPFNVAINNASHNVAAFAWNNTLGATFQSTKTIWNTALETKNGTYQPSQWEIDPIAAFNDFTAEFGTYLKKSTPRTLFQNLKSSASDLNNYEMPFQLILAHRISFFETHSIDPNRLPAAEEIFSNNIRSREMAEIYAQKSTYKNYFNANEFIKENNPVFDLISTQERTIVDITTTKMNVLKVQKWLVNKLNRLSTQSLKMNYQSILQIYVKEQQYSNVEIAKFTSQLKSIAAKENLNVNIKVDKIK